MERIKYLKEMMTKKQMLINIAPSHEKPVLMEELADMEVTLRLFEVTYIGGNN